MPKSNFCKFFSCLQKEADMLLPVEAASAKTHELGLVCLVSLAIKAKENILNACPGLGTFLG